MKLKKYKKVIIILSIVFILFQMIIPVVTVSANTDHKKKNEDSGLEILTMDKKGNIYYDGEPLLVGKGNDKIPANLSKLMEKGVPKTLKLSRASVGEAKIVYKGQVTYGMYTVGDFTVNGKSAFCMEHPKGTPATNQPNTGLNVYDNKSIAAVLYWGWGGTKNIFTDRKLGIVATSLALSHFYYGDTPGTPPSGYDTLITKGKNKDVPGHGIDLNGVNSLVNLSVTFNGKKQVSKTATFRGDSKNSITYKVPANITLVNETTGATATNKSVKISGGQKFHLEANPNVTKTVTSAKLKGTIKEFQPLIVKPVTSGVQDIGTWRYFDDPKMVVSFKAVFKARNGDFEITKKGSDGKLLAGAEYDVKNSSNVLVKHVKTGANGKVKLTDLVAGVYTVTETKAPAGYTLDKTPKKVTVTAGQTALMTFTNKQVFVQVKVKKGDTETGDAPQGDSSLQGAKYGVFDDAKATVKLDEITIGKDLTALSKKLPMNGASRTLYVKETKAPTGYNIDPTIYKVVIKQANATAELFVGNATSKDKVIEGGFDLLKTANKPLLQTTNDLTLGGAEFSVKLKSSDKVVQKQTTDKNGKATFSKLPYGTYVVSETKTPAGYKPVPNFEVKITKENQTFHYDLVDKVIESTIKVVKKDKETQEVIPRAGATFKIKDSKGQYIEQLTDEETPKKVTEFTTSADGTLQLPEMLPYGKYTLEEIKAPDGYLLSGETVSFEVTKETDQQVITLSFFDAPAMGKVKGQKMKEIIDREESTSEKIVYKEVPAEGITFDIIANKDIVTYDGTLRAKKGDVVDTVETDSDGKFESNKSLYIPKGNEYKLVETNTPENYVPIEPVIFSIDYKDQMTEIVYEIINVKNMIKKGSFDLLKTANKPLFTGRVNPLLREKPLTLEGAEFTVMSKNREIVQIGTTDENGYLAFSDLPYGHYFVSETKTPDGYKPVEDFTIDITENGQTFHYTLIDEVIESTIKVIKKDLETGEVIPRAGAKFKIKDSLGNYVEQYVSEPILEKITEFETNEDGTLELPEMLPYGKYELEEVQAPDGYLLSAETVPFEVTKETDQQEIELSFFDAPAMGKIKGQKMKEIVDTEKSTADKVVYKEVPAEGITFDIIANKDIITYDGTLRAKKGDVVDTVKTDSDGKFESTKSLYIPKGNEYKLVETNTPENYVPIEPVIFSIAYKEQSTEIVYESVDVKNMLKKGDVEISKKALGGTDELAGATLNIKGKDIDLTCVSSDKSSKKFKLPNGNYILTETIANKGYELNKQQVPFEVKDGKVSKVVIYNKKIEKPTVPLIKKIQKSLPTTGDTRLDFIAVGLGLLMIAGVVLYLRKRKTNQQ